MATLFQMMTLFTAAALWLLAPVILAREQGGCWRLMLRRGRQNFADHQHHCVHNSLSQTENLIFWQYWGQFKSSFMHINIWGRKDYNIWNIWGSLRAYRQIYEAGRTGSAPSPAFSEGSTRDWLSVRWITAVAGTSSLKLPSLHILGNSCSSKCIKYQVYIVDYFKKIVNHGLLDCLLSDLPPSRSPYTFKETLSSPPLGACYHHFVVLCLLRLFEIQRLWRLVHIYICTPIPLILFKPNPSLIFSYAPAL